MDIKYYKQERAILLLGLWRSRLLLHQLSFAMNQIWVLLCLLVSPESEFESINRAFWKNKLISISSAIANLPRQWILNLNFLSLGCQREKFFSIKSILLHSGEFLNKLISPFFLWFFSLSWKSWFPSSSYDVASPPSWKNAKNICLKGFNFGFEMARWKPNARSIFALTNFCSDFVNA